jgi:uncharacterized membrane protein
VLFIRIRDIPVALTSLAIAVPLAWWIIPILIRRKWDDISIFCVFVIILAGSLAAGTLVLDQIKSLVSRRRN